MNIKKFCMLFYNIQKNFIFRLNIIQWYITIISNSDHFQHIFSLMMLKVGIIETILYNHETTLYSICYILCHKVYLVQQIKIWYLSIDITLAI